MAACGSHHQQARDPVDDKAVVGDGPGQHEHVAAATAHQGVLACAGNQGVVAQAAIEAVVQGVAFQGVIEAAGHQVFDARDAVRALVACGLAGAQVQGHGRCGRTEIGRVDARTADQGVVAQATNQGVVALGAVEHVGIAIARELVGKSAAHQVFHADQTDDAVGDVLVAGLVGQGHLNPSRQAGKGHGVIARATVQGVGCAQEVVQRIGAAAHQGVIACATDQVVRTVGADDQIVQRIACAGEGGAQQLACTGADHVFKVGPQGVAVQRNRHRVGALVKAFRDHIACGVDQVGVVAQAA